MAEQTRSQQSSEPTDSTQVAETTMKKFLDAGSVNAVYGEAATYGDITIIPAAEVVSVMGFGLGAGTGGAGQGGGSGAGGGGGIQSRPVAAVVITPNGVRIAPIVDVTKVWLAGLTTAGFVLATLARLRRRRNKAMSDR